MLGTIYLITNNINQKKYIGWTRYKNPEKRFQRHVHISHNPTRIDHHAIHKAMKKYGENNFTFTLLYQSKDLEHTKEMEKFFIKQYNSFGRNGYNMTKGGEGMLGYKHSEETKHKQSISKKKLFDSGFIHPMTGKKGLIGDKNGNIKSRKQYEIFYDDGKSEIITGLKGFAKINNHHRGSLVALASGKKEFYKDIIKIVRK